MNFKRLLKPILVILAILILTLSVSAMTGSGTEGDPYIIYNATDLKNVENDMAAYYELANDIDLGGGNFEPIGYVSGTGYTAFTGHFDGKGHKIYNGSIGITEDYSRDTCIGIFAYNKGTIQNVGAKNIAVSGQSRVAVLAGHNYGGTIQNCYSTGSVEGQDYIGGLVGTNYNSSTIINCYSTCSVDGREGIGGLVGRNYNSTIQNCYSTGIPTGTESVGGLVGSISGGTDTENYWDTTTSETSTSAMGTGKTTAQMKDIDTYVGNWDMVAIGSYVDEDWFIDDGNDYPKLGWEYEETGGTGEATNVLFIFSNF